MMSKIVGYARVSTKKQELSSQIDKLKKDNRDYTKKPGLDNCLETLETGDTLLSGELIDQVDQCLIQLA